MQLIILMFIKEKDDSRFVYSLVKHCRDLAEEFIEGDKLQKVSKLAAARRVSVTVLTREVDPAARNDPSRMAPVVRSLLGLGLHRRVVTNFPGGPN